MQSDTFIYFDVGGVALLDFSGTDKWSELKRDLGVSTDEVNNAFNSLWQSVRHKICTEYDVDDLVPELRKIEGVQIPDEYSLLEDIVQRFEQNTSIWPVIESASEQHEVGLLTNMYPRMFSKIEEKGLLPQVKWQVVVDSSVVGAQKPEEAIFEAAERAAGVSPEQICFFDNSQKNVEVAKARGWQGFVYDPQRAAESARELGEVLGVFGKK